ncbi:hypothetical protein [Mucilaginibacter pedocola]|uniref:Uncharacterized protein n=1 Tax=Mucilaginibacter pedocola TaxID=1792845 RepID=A0A1S9P9P9_9SPHI|nr:hypothetical protein [Mucilaginibacter pedocola]OOQ57704.1 hypothetical protein BC343_12975 [Mucilaginibacter pedocola]
MDAGQVIVINSDLDKFKLAQGWAVLIVTLTVPWLVLLIQPGWGTATFILFTNLIFAAIAVNRELSLKFVIDTESQVMIHYRRRLWAEQTPVTINLRDAYAKLYTVNDRGNKFWELAIIDKSQQNKKIILTEFKSGYHERDIRHVWLTLKELGVEYSYKE